TKRTYEHRRRQTEHQQQSGDYGLAQQRDHGNPRRSYSRPPMALSGLTMQHDGRGKEEMKLRALLTWSAVAMVFAPTALRADVDRLKDAREVLTEMAGSKDEGIPVDLIEQAKCLAIVPGVKKAAVGIGGEYGRGYLVCRRADGKTWSAPGGVRIEGGSVGFQIGGAETDIIMIVR